MRSITAADGYRDEIKRITNGRGPDVIIEMLANINLNHDLALIAPRGRIVIVGSRGNVEIAPRLIMAPERDRHRAHAVDGVGRRAAPRLRGADRRPRATAR